VFRSVFAESAADDAHAGERPLLGRAVRALIGGALAIDVAVIAQQSGMVVEQNLAADSTLFGHIQDRAGINPLTARRTRESRRCRTMLRADIFTGGKQTKSEESRRRGHDGCLADALARAPLGFRSASKTAHGTAANPGPDTSKSDFHHIQGERTWAQVYSDALKVSSRYGADCRESG
jgi:hypothetical protein